MIYQYVVTLKSERKRYVDFISVVAIVVSIVAFAVMLTSKQPFSYIFPAAAVLLIAGLAWNVYNRKKNAPLKFGRLLLIAGITWFAMPFVPWVGILLLLLALLERPAKLPMEIGFNDDRIVFNTLVRRRLQWEELSNVVLRDGILTIDFKDNRLFSKRNDRRRGRCR